MNHTNLKISCDLDDTIFSFYEYYYSKFGIPKTDRDITKNVIGPLKKDKEFWINQPILRIPTFEITQYTTSRVIPKRWIKEQLAIHHLQASPVYQIKGFGLSKYSMVKKQSCNLHIDDSIGVFIDLNKKGIPTLLIDTPYNREWGPIGRIYSLDKEEVYDAYYLFMDTIFPNFRKLCK
jgi:hypothetical protein